MRIIDHHIAGGAGSSTRTGDVFDPNTGLVQATVNLGGQAVLDAAVAAARAMMGDGCIDLAHLGGLVTGAGYEGFVEVEVLSERLWACDQESVLQAVVERFERHVAPSLR